MSQDFYSRQAAARGQSRWLVIGFVVSLLVVALALDLVLFTFLASASAGHATLAPLQFAAANPGTAFASTLIVMGVLGLASLYKSMELRGGGGVVARSLGAVLVAGDSTDIKRRRLLNVVSEMSIASGVPMPEVYVLEQEAAINAFAAGHTPANAAVTVTQGALDRLNRDQLQGVIGHEFSHILNGDMRLNVQLMGWVFGLFVVALIGRLIVNFSPRDRRNNNSAIIALGFAVMALGYVGLLLGRVMQAAVSRQRERLADASGVQFTRNPQGLKEALVKIAAIPDGSILLTPHAEQAAHMFFADGLNRLFATHPPILERIRELDPQFDERELAQAIQAASAADAMSRQDEPDAVRATAVGMAGAAAFAGTGAVIPASTGAPAVPMRSSSDAGRITSSAGRMDSVHLDHAKAIAIALPETLQEMAASPGRAQAFMLALLLSQEPGVRERQLAMLGNRLDANNFAAVQQIVPVADSVEPLLRLPALQQVFPALRRAPASQRRMLGELAGELIHADARIDVFEFCLAKLLWALLSDELDATAPHGTVSLEAAQSDLQVLFSVLAQLGAGDERGARAAYESGMAGVLPMRRPAFAFFPDWPAQLDGALTRLELLHPLAKKVVIDGLVRTIACDDVMTEAESELLRTVCALLHCPLPPLLGGPAAGP